MSETKPVEETPVVAPTEVPAVEPVATEAAAVEAPKETPAEATEAAPAETAAAETTEAAAEPAKEETAEVTPATDGILGHKGPGLVKSLRFSKRYFYFSEEPVEAKNLATFLAEKGAAATAAWATVTGKGLVFFAKRAEDKATPTGILNLSEVTDVAKDGTTEFTFKVNGQKHSFQAANTAERDSWLAAIEAKTAEANAEKETVTGGEAYKAELEKLSKPATPEKKAKEAKDESAPAEASAKSRSQSRKRASIFGTILGKKDAEEKKEETPAEATTEEAAPAETAAEPVVAPEVPVEAAPAAEAPAAESTEDKKEEKKDAKAKRASIFGNFFQKVTSPAHEKTEKETTVSSTAPQLENPVDESASQPIEPESVTAPATEAAEAPKDAPATETTLATSSKGLFSFGKKDEKKEEGATPEAPKDKRRTSIFGTLGSKKEKKAEGEEAAEGEAKPKSNKLGGLFRKPSKAVKTEEKKDKEAAPEAEAIPEGDKPEPISKDAPAEAAPAEAEKTEPEAAPAEPVNVASAATPVQAAA